MSRKNQQERKRNGDAPQKKSWKNVLKLLLKQRLLRTPLVKIPESQTLF
jgi:hypothetical protein